MNPLIERVNTLFAIKTKEEASYWVFGKITTYPDFVRVYRPNTPYKKLLPGMEPNKKRKRIVGSGLHNKENTKRAIRRTKKQIADLILCNDFDLFATFTFSPEKTEDRANPDLVKRQMSNWLKNQQKRTGYFQYLIVPEFHKDGISLHFHALIGGYKGKLIDSGININGRKCYHFKSYTLGFNSAVYIDDKNKVSSYVSKYITKDMPQFGYKHRFWASTGLNKPLTVDIDHEWYLTSNPTKMYANEYGLTFEAPLEEFTFSTVENATAEDSPDLSEGLL